MNALEQWFYAVSALLKLTVYIQFMYLPTKAITDPPPLNTTYPSIHVNVWQTRNVRSNPPLKCRYRCLPICSYKTNLHTYNTCSMFFDCF